MSISKKILLTMLALFAAVCTAVGLFLLPAINSSAADDGLLNTLGTGSADDVNYFNIDENGVFNGLTAEGNLAVGNKKTKIILPASVKAIGEPEGTNQSVFDNTVRPYIVEVAYAEGCALTHINKNAFNGCVNMTTINIPDSAENGLTIHENAFANCTGATTINYYARKATVTSNMGNPFAINNDNYVTPVTVNIKGTAENPIKQIPKELFCRVARDNDSFTSANGHKGIKTVNFEYVDLSDSNTEAGNVGGEAAWGVNAFRDCTSLEKVTFKNCSIPYINQAAFYGCTSLNVIEGLESIKLKTIADEAFFNCSSLFSVKLGAEVANIKKDAFASCTRLIEVINLSQSLSLTLKDTGNGRVAEHALVIHTTDTTSVKQYNNFSFITDTSDNRNYHYLLGYSGNATSISLPEKYDNAAYYIFEKAFYNEKSLNSVTIPKGAVREIKESAFAGSGITSITFPSDLVGIYSGAFEGCASLSSVTFDTDASGSSSIQQLGSNAFKDCVKLESITFPKSLQRIDGAAFEGCTALKNVEFYECKQKHEHTADCRQLTKISGSAFKGCLSLKIVKLPAQVTSIEDEVFAKCDSLQTVYLPANASYGSNAFGTDNEKLLLITTGKAAYNEIIADADGNNSKKLKNYKDNLTYTVYVKLDGSGYEESAVYKLFNKNGSYELQNDGSWESGHTMPTQNNYKRSVWYDSGSYQTQVNVEKLTEMLKSSAFATDENGYDYLTIYAKYINYPAFQNFSSLEYSSGLELGMEGILDKCFGNATRSSDYTYTVSEHYFTPNGYEEKDNEWDWDTTKVIKDAGKYFLQVNLNPDYGEWAKPYSHEFYITPINFDISANNLVKWKPVGTDNTTLLPELGGNATKLYFYGNPLIPYLKEQAGLTGKGERDVINSYAPYTGNPIELELVWRDGISYGKIIEDSYETFIIKNNEEVKLDGNAQTAQGIYFTRVNLQSNNNYRIVVNGLDSNNEKTLTELGLKFKGYDGNYTVTKTWYIAVSDSLHLAQNDDKKDTAYGISVDANGTIGTYLGDVKLPQRPAVMTFMIDSNPVTGVQHNELISFTLTRNGEMITKNGAVKLGSPAAAKDNFEYYINKSMPAGEYVLTFYIDDYVDAQGNRVVGNRGGQEFGFIIAEKALEGNRVTDVRKMLVDASVAYDSTAEYQFAPTQNIGLLNSDGNQITDRTGIWKTDAYNALYERFEIYYYVKSGAKKNYEGDAAPSVYNPISAYDDGNVWGYTPKGLGVYTVYYQIKAPNYSTVIEGLYELKITYKLTLDDFVVSDFEYTGSSLVSEIRNRLDPRDLDAYYIYTLADDSPEAEALRKQYHNGSRDSYTSTGTHYVYIAIKDGKKDFISFDNGIAQSNFVSPVVNGSVKTFLKVEINIVATKNSELTHLAVDNWEYGEFLWANRPVWDLVFNRNYETYWFVLTSKDNAEEQYWLYGKQDLNDNLADGKLGFNRAPHGEYTLTGYAPSEVDGIAPFEISIDVTVLKATPKFSSHPYIDGWVYGYDKFEDNLNAAKILSDYPLSGNGSEIADKIVVKYATEAEFKKDDPTLHEKLSSLYGANNQLSVGYYYMVFTLADGVNDNFTEWQYGVRFRVAKGQNYWNTTPVMHDWIYGDDNVNNSLKFEPKFGSASDVKLEYRSTDSVLSGWVTQISALKEYKNGHLSVGTYEFRATVGGTGNYDDLVFQMTFNVLPRTQNVWKDAPSIKGWVKGNFTTENLPFATAAVGEVTYTVTDEDGRVYEFNPDNASKVLNGLKVGTYTLTATVIGTDEYETLTTSVEFSVSEDAVTMTGLMVATIVFAVIAVGLAAAGLTLFILQSKKADAEFRRAVRNELRRK